MKYIAAANPETVLALIQDIYRLQGALKELAGKCQGLDPDFEIDKWREWWEGGGMSKNDRKTLDSIIGLCLLIFSAGVSVYCFNSIWLWMIIYPVAMFLYGGFSDRTK